VRVWLAICMHSRLYIRQAGKPSVGSVYDCLSPVWAPWPTSFILRRRRPFLGPLRNVRRLPSSQLQLLMVKILHNQPSLYGSKPSENVKSLPSHRSHRPAVSLALRQTPVYTARPRIRGCCVARRAYLRPCFCWYSLRLPTEGMARLSWPG